MARCPPSARSADRPKAFGIFSAIAAGGASVGLPLGGVLIQAVSWRWCLYVNLAIAVPTAIVALRLLRNQRQPVRAPIDVPGVAIGSGGLFTLVYGFSNAETHSRSDPITVLALAASTVLLIGFIALERRVEHPLLPLHIVWDRARGGAYATIAPAGSAVFAVFLFPTYYVQQDLGFSPVQTGLGFLPMTVMIVLTATTVQPRVLPRTGAKPLVVSRIQDHHIPSRRLHLRGRRPQRLWPAAAPSAHDPDRSRKRHLAGDRAGAKSASKPRQQPPAGIPTRRRERQQGERQARSDDRRPQDPPPLRRRRPVISHTRVIGILPCRE